MAYYPKIRRFIVSLCLLVLIGSQGITASAMVYTPPEDQTEPSAPETYTAELGSCTIGEGEIISYTTVSSQFAGKELPEGMYAGELTVNITGPVIIESGGCLEIGTLSIGGKDEASPVIKGVLSQSGLIIVKAGGKLNLKSVTLDTQGEGFLIVQEPGGSISLSGSQLDSSLIQWAPAFVNNLNDDPDDLWLAEGTFLFSEHLPSYLRTDIENQGTEERVDVPVAWDMSGYDGRTSGEVTLTGQFLSENGEPIASARPLTLTVHWYETQRITVTDVTWRGENACSADFAVLELPEYTDLWGEISSDGGYTWTRWSEFEVIENDGSILCIFCELENTPRLYRICAKYDSHDGYAFWSSDVFHLPNEDSDDQGGNRGGSITPNPPDRVPQPGDSQDSGTNLIPWLPQFPGSIIDSWLPQDPTDDASSGNTQIPGDTSDAEAVSPEDDTEEDPHSEQGGTTQGTGSNPEDAMGNNGSASQNSGLHSNPLTSHIETDPADGENGREIAGDTEDNAAAAPESTPGEDGASVLEESEEDPSASIPPTNSSSETTDPQQADHSSSDAPAPLSVAGQVGLAVAGIGACTAVGLAVAGVGPFRRSKGKRGK